MGCPKRKNELHLLDTESSIYVFLIIKIIKKKNYIVALKGKTGIIQQNNEL